MKNNQDWKEAINTGIHYQSKFRLRVRFIRETETYLNLHRQFPDLPWSRRHRRSANRIGNPEYPKICVNRDTQKTRPDQCISPSSVCRCRTSTMICPLEPKRLCGKNKGCSEKAHGSPKKYKKRMNASARKGWTFRTISKPLPITSRRELYDVAKEMITPYVMKQARPADVADCIQEAWVAVLTGLKKEDFEYRGDRAYTGWLCRVISRSVANFYRRKAPPVGSLPCGSDIADKDLTPIEAQQQNIEIARLLMDELRNANERYYQVVNLRIFECLNVSEAARRLGRKRELIRSDLCRAKQLMRIIAKRLFEDEKHG